MTFILISGKENVGKTHVCNKLHSIMEKDGFTGHDMPPDTSSMTEHDFIAHYEKNGRCIIVMNVPSDTDNRMKDFAQYLDRLSQKDVYPEIIITTIRENNNDRYLMSHMLELLEAYANGIENLENYYKQNIASVTSFAPRTLCHNAFVLHLEKQQVSGTKKEKDVALAPYWDDCAETVKGMLKLAIERDLKEKSNPTNTDVS